MPKEKTPFLGLNISSLENHPDAFDRWPGGLDENFLLIDLAIANLPQIQQSCADVFFTFTQTLASATWNVQHNLGKYPSVSVVDSSGHQVIGDVAYNDLNRLTISFSAPFAGCAYLN